MILANLIYISDPSAYTNDNAIPNTINYITRHNDENIFYYGNWPPTPDSAIELFEHLRSHLSFPKRYECRQSFSIFGLPLIPAMLPISLIHLQMILPLSLLHFFLSVWLPMIKFIIHIHTLLYLLQVFLPSQKPLIGKVWGNYLAQVCELALTRYDIHLTVKPKTNTVIQK